MEFNINQLEKMDSDGSDEAAEAFEAYADSLIEQFSNSPEGEERLKDDPGMGFWAYQLMDYGYNYVGVTIVQMNLGDAKEILTDIFPRKISLDSPDDADDAIPELLAFWRFLKRQFRLPQADRIMRYLDRIGPGYKRIMNDPAKFGMAKSVFAAGRAAGFDMSDKNEVNRFMLNYNDNISSEGVGFPSLDDLETISYEEDTDSKGNKAKKAKKSVRKLKKMSRKKNRNKKKR